MTPTAISPKSPTKAKDAHERLLAMAQQLGPNAKMPTVQQLRQELQVSITTLDGVLTQLEHQNIIFRKQGSGIFVSPRLKQKCVGLVCDPEFFQSGSSPFWQQLVESARTRATIGGEAFRFYLAIPSATCPVHDDLIEDVQARRIQGVLFVGNNEAAQGWFEEHGMPAVVFAGKGRYTVRISYEELVAQAANQLHNAGCRNIALVVQKGFAFEDCEPPFNSYPAIGFLAWLQSMNIPPRPEMVWGEQLLLGSAKLTTETRQEQGYQAALDLFDGTHPVPDGLISTDDMMTRGLLAGLRKLGIQPGRDVQLVSHINRGSTVLHGEEAEMTLIEVDPAEIVQQMFNQLEVMMDGRIPAEEETVISPRLLP